jgi:hypothetical protein
VSFANQGTCQSRKTTENYFCTQLVADFPNQQLVANPKPEPGTFAGSGASRRTGKLEGESAMLGKLAGAWLGEKAAGPNRGAKGAIIGYGAAALARRSVPALAAVALGGWAFRKLRQRRRSRPTYPSEASVDS